MKICPPGRVPHLVSKSVFLVAMSLLLGAASAIAQTTKPVANSQRIPVAKTDPAPAAAPLPLNRCETCKHAVPVEVRTSTQDAVILSGPPDGKGAPVEYQVFVQMTAGAAWELAARGEIAKPGERHPHCFANSAQIMVLIWSETPFGSIATFEESCK